MRSDWEGWKWAEREFKRVNFKGGQRGSSTSKCKEFPSFIHETALKHYAHFINTVTFLSLKNMSPTSPPSESRPFLACREKYRKQIAGVPEINHKFDVFFCNCTFLDRFEKYTKIQ